MRVLAVCLCFHFPAPSPCALAGRPLSLSLPQGRIAGLTLPEIQQFDRHKKSVVAAIKALGAMVRMTARRVDADRLEEELELKVATRLVKRSV